MNTEEMAKKLGLSEKTLQKLWSVLREHPRVSQAIIYGSRAKGNFRIGSDIDLTLKGQSIHFSELMKIEDEIDDLLLPYMVDISDYGQLENQELIAHIDRVGIIFYISPNVA
jgi:uncharacterized protein